MATHIRRDPHTDPVGAAGGPPQRIFIIRHGEKPPNGNTPAPGPPFGIDINGNQNPHSLIPRGWQRCGALAVLFDPVADPLRAGLAVPGHLFCPSYGSEAKTIAHRTYQTILQLSDQSGILISSPYPEGAERDLAKAVVANSSGTVLICWEHHHIPALATAIPTAPGTTIPPTWPDNRFDVIWCFTLPTAAGPPRYEFSQIPQLLLAGDSDQPIPAT